MRLLSSSLAEASKTGDANQTGSNVSQPPATFLLKSPVTEAQVSLSSSLLKSPSVTQATFKLSSAAAVSSNPAATVTCATNGTSPSSRVSSDVTRSEVSPLNKPEKVTSQLPNAEAKAALHPVSTEPVTLATQIKSVPTLVCADVAPEVTVSSNSPQNDINPSSQNSKLVQRKSFRCKTCGYKCQLREILYKHLVTRHKKKLFSCGFPGCSYRSKFTSAVEAHATIHDSPIVQSRHEAEVELNGTGRRSRRTPKVLTQTGQLCQDLRPGAAPSISDNLFYECGVCSVVSDSQEAAVAHSLCHVAGSVSLH